MPQNIQVTEDEMKTRLEIIAAMIINEGLTQSQVVHACLERHPDWNVQRRQVYNYYARVWEEMSQEALGVDRQSYYYLSIRQIDVMIGKAMAANDQKAFAALMTNRIKLMALDKPQADMDWRKEALAAGVDPEKIQTYLVKVSQNADTD